MHSFRVMVIQSWQNSNFLRKKLIFCQFWMVIDLKRCIESDFCFQQSLDHFFSRTDQCDRGLHLNIKKLPFSRYVRSLFNVALVCIALKLIMFWNSFQADFALVDLAQIWYFTPYFRRLLNENLFDDFWITNQKAIFFSKFLYIFKK